jgi:hypothetical protein
MGLDGALGVGEAVRANPNTTKRSKKKKKNLQYPFRFSPENLHKNNPNQNKNQEIKPKFFYCYEPYQERWNKELEAGKEKEMKQVWKWKDPKAW